MIYATLDEAWAKKPRVKRITQHEKLKRITPMKYESKIVLKDPEVISLLKDIDDPDAYILERIKPKVVESFVSQQKIHHKELKKDDTIYFIYFLILLVLLY